MQAPNENQNLFFSKYAQTAIRVKARQLVRRPGFTVSDQEDIEQELTLHLLMKADQFDSDRSSINTFISQVVGSAAAMIVRKRERIKRCGGEGVEIKSLESTMIQSEGQSASLAASISSDDNYRRLGREPISATEQFESAYDVANAIAELAPELQSVCRSLSVRNHRQTRSELGMSRRAFDAALVKIREHFCNLQLDTQFLNPI